MYFIISNLQKQIHKYQVRPKFSLLSFINKMMLDYTSLAENYNAIDFIKQIKQIKYMNYINLTSNPNAIKLIQQRLKLVNPKISFSILCENCNAIKLIRKKANHKLINKCLINITANINSKVLNLFKNYIYLSNDIHIWNNISINPGAIKIIKHEIMINLYTNLPAKLENRMCRININYFCINYLCKNPKFYNNYIITDKFDLYNSPGLIKKYVENKYIDKIWLSLNPNIFNINKADYKNCIAKMYNKI